MIENEKGSIGDGSAGLSRKFLIFAIVFPIVLLLGLMLHKQRIVSAGTRVVLKISGYDPRDLLSGHYLIYVVEYGVSIQCPYTSEIMKAFVCLSDQTFRFGSPSNCQLPIVGSCENGRFRAGIERFYVPQENARELERHVMGRNAAIELAVKNGQAQVIDLLIDGQSWKKKLESIEPSSESATSQASPSATPAQ